MTGRGVGRGDRAAALAYARQKYGTEPDRPWLKLPDYEVLRHSVSRKWYAIFMTLRRSQLGLTGDEPIEVMNIKCATELLGGFLQEKGFLPAYHMNRQKWLTVLLDGSLSAERLPPLLDMSYELTSRKMPSAVRLVTAQAGDAALMKKLTKIWQQTAPDMAELDEADRAYREPEFVNRLAKLSVLLLAVKKDGQPVGFMGLLAGRLEMLFIMKRYQGCGLGRKFVQRAINDYAAAQVAVETKNTAARAFFERVGFNAYRSSNAAGLTYMKLND